MKNHALFMKYCTGIKNKFGIPDLLKQDFNKVPENLMPFSFRENMQYPALCHFLIDDEKFEVVWNDPAKGLLKVKNEKVWAACGPDFSIFSDWPDAVNIYSVFRSRLISRFWQDNGIKVIPTLMFGGVKTLEYAFIGIPKNQILALPVPACMNQDEFENFIAGYDVIRHELKPRLLICFGKPLAILSDDIPKIYFPKGHFQTKKFRGDE